MNQLCIFLILSTITVTLPLPTHNVINCNLLTSTHCLDNPELVLECNRHDLCKELRVSNSNNCEFCLYVAAECRKEPDEEEEGELEQELCEKGSNTSCDAIVDRICDYIINLSESGKTVPSEEKICSSLGYCTYRGEDADGRVSLERQLEVIARLLSVPINSIPRDELSCEKVESLVYSVKIRIEHRISNYRKLGRLCP